MVYRFEDIVEKNVDDLMSVCGNTPGIDRNPHFTEGRAARRQWLLEAVEKYGTAGVLAYDGTRPVAFVECTPAHAHPLGPFAADPARTAVIDCAWYRQDAGVAARRAILDDMFARKWFDKLLGKKCRYVDVLTIKNAPIMQYDFYKEYGFRDAVELQGHATVRYLLRYPVKGEKIEPRIEQINFCDAGKNVLVLGVYRQCHMPFMIAGKIRKAVEGIDGLTVKVTDYWATGNPVACEAAINGKPAFDGPVFFMDDEQIRESVKAKML
ncbi:MAG: hypothetical protein A4E28_01862 [Methanocella sp. PtaU1.Bin125]|nr:MAG: hypothetical protein A4E28_01862 [Methanocella sp. PtaU1.Bin125]